MQIAPSHALADGGLPPASCRRVFKETGKLLTAFVLGAAATVVGTVVAFKLVPLTALGASDSWKIAAALAARHGAARRPL